MKKLSIAATGVCLYFLCGCAGQADKAEPSANILKENERRIASLENNIHALNSQIEQLNARGYEIRTKTGQRTSMTIVPVSPGAPSPAVVQNPAPVNPNAGAPRAKLIDPKASPAPLNTKHNSAQTAPKPASQPRPLATAPHQSASVAGPSGQLSATNLDNLALPPADLPPETIPVPTGNVASAAPTQPVPLPLIDEGALALPPETSASPAPAPQSPAPRPQARSAAPTTQGEEAAYKAALNAARSGRTAEGINLFNNFLAQYPNSKYAANADYWIGECLYAQGKYQDALSSFQSVNNAFPTHHKNADALLKAGLTLNKMGDKTGAAEKFRTLIANFPNSDAAKRARSMGYSR